MSQQGSLTKVPSMRKEEMKEYFHKLRQNREQTGQTTPTRAPQGDATPNFVTQVSKEDPKPSPPAQHRNGYVRPTQTATRVLLPDQCAPHVGKHLLVLDLDETLVHSSFKFVPQSDIVLDINLEGQMYQVYVKVRPHAQTFLAEVAKHYEVIIFTASLSKYADPLMDRLDPGRKLCVHRLFREHCSLTNGAYVKDMSLLNRPLHKVMIVDNSPVAYLFQPRNAIPCTSWFDDPNDTELLDMLPMLRTIATKESCYEVLDEFHANNTQNGCLL